MPTPPSRRSRRRRTGNKFRYDRPLSEDEVFGDVDNESNLTVRRPGWMKMIIVLLVILAVALVSFVVFVLGTLSTRIPQYDNKALDDAAAGN